MPAVLRTRKVTNKASSPVSKQKRDRKLGAARPEVDKAYVRNPLMSLDEKRVAFDANPAFTFITFAAFCEGLVECDTRRETTAVNAARERRWATFSKEGDAKWKAYHAAGGKKAAKKAAAEKKAAAAVVAAEDEEDDDDDHEELFVSAADNEAAYEATTTTVAKSRFWRDVL